MEGLKACHGGIHVLFRFSTTMIDAKHQRHLALAICCTRSKVTFLVRTSSVLQDQLYLCGVVSPVGFRLADFVLLSGSSIKSSFLTIL